MEQCHRCRRIGPSLHIVCLDLDFMDLPAILRFHLDFVDIHTLEDILDDFGEVLEGDALLAVVISSECPK